MSSAATHASSAWNKYVTGLSVLGITFDDAASEAAMKALFEALFDEIQSNISNSGGALD